MNCVFCQIVAGTSPSHKLWEDDQHLAFLSIFPNTEGVAVVITKQHYGSYVFDLPEDVLASLTQAAQKVGKLLDSKLEDVGRTAMVAEGFGVDHAHIKLFPMHGTATGKWEEHKSAINSYFPLYPGYISSHDAGRAPDDELGGLAEKIRG